MFVRLRQRRGNLQRHQKGFHVSAAQKGFHVSAVKKVSTSATPVIPANLSKYKKITKGFHVSHSRDVETFAVGPQGRGNLSAKFVKKISKKVSPSLPYPKRSPR